MKVSGPACLWRPHSRPIPRHSGPTPRHSRLDRESPVPFSVAFDIVRRDLAAAAGSDVAGGVYAAHLQMLEDPMVQETVEANIAAGMSDREAVEAARDSICAMFANIDDEYLRARTEDVRDVFRRLINALCGAACFSSQCPPGAPSILASCVIRSADNLSAAAEYAPGGHCELSGSAVKPVIVAEQLFPSDMKQIDPEGITGIICAKGSATSHVCIIAHSMGVPIQVGVDISGIREGDLVEVDDPLAGGPRQIEAKVRAAGRKLYVNAGSLEEIRAAIAAGADGIGVFRTEFLFMGRESMPTFEEQRALYAEALEACAGKPLIIRLLDVGGDKALPYLPMPREDNPFLGVRGIRFSLAHPELLETQLRAIVAAVSDVPGSQVKVMIPMVCTVDEIRQVRQMLTAVAGEDAPVRLGIMIETPAAALDAGALAAECDFFSIGTNDLTQYIMAADRCNASVSGLYDALSPAVRRAVEMTVAAAHAAVRPGFPSGIPVGICGELASDPRATGFLLSAGLDSLSLSHLF